MVLRATTTTTKKMTLKQMKTRVKSHEMKSGRLTLPFVNALACLQSSEKKGATETRKKSTVDTSSLI